jgi:hypothetical protein
MSKLKMYCSNCGSQSLYSAEKPKFCQSCGSSFSDSIAKNVQTNEDTQIHEEALDEDSDVKVPNMSGLDVEITKYESPNETLGQIAGTSSPQSTPRTKGQNSSTKTSEEILAEFQREAGTRGRENND